MKGKKSFILYADLIHTFEELTNEQSGIVFLWVLKYVNDLNPPLPEEQSTRIICKQIKIRLKEDLKNWEGIREKRSEAGKKSAEKRKQKSTNSTSVKSVKQNSTNQTVNVNVNVNELLKYFNNIFNKKCRVFSESIINKYKARLKEGYFNEDFKLAMLNASKDKFHIEQNFKYCTLEFFSRPQTIDKFANESKKLNKKYIPTL